MKYTVHITLEGSVEVEATTHREAIFEAENMVEVTGGNVFDTSARVFGSHIVIVKD
jgi:hypothetical protein